MTKVQEGDVETYLVLIEFTQTYYSQKPRYNYAFLVKKLGGDRRIVIHSKYRHPRAVAEAHGGPGDRRPGVGAAGRASGRQAGALMLDEFAALGHLEPVEWSFGLTAGYSVQLWAILQDLHQLKCAYGEGAGTFLANAGVIQVFNVADIDTATWVSRSMGAMTEAYYTTGQSKTYADGSWFASYGSSENLNLTLRDLATPDEVMRMDGGHLLLLRPGARPTLARKVRCYADAGFLSGTAP